MKHGSLLPSVPLMTVPMPSPCHSSVHYFDFPEEGRLGKGMVDAYEQDGIIVLNNFLTEAECDALLAEKIRLIDEFQPTCETTEIFTADTAQSDTKRGKYFLDSTDKISFFFEEGAFESGRLVADKRQSINKIGHALGELNPVFRAATFRDSTRTLIEQLGVSNPVLNESMMICKPPKIGGEVKPHQDSTYLYTNPNTTTTVWIALVDVTLLNGCLYTKPGSHKGPLEYRYVRDGRKLSYADMKGNPLDDDRINAMAAPWSQTEDVHLPMAKGAAAIFAGNLVHGSGPNTSALPRDAYTFHVTSGDSIYPGDNWLQRDKFAPLKGDV